MSIADDTMKVAYHAMTGLAHRAEVRSDNIANAETPGFLAKSVPFESALASAMEQGDVDRRPSRPVNYRDTLPDAHGNTVELETEYVEMIEDGVRYETVVAAYNYKVSLFRNAIGSR